MLLWALMFKKMVKGKAGVYRAVYKTGEFLKNLFKR